MPTVDDRAPERLVILNEEHSVLVNGREVDLTAREYEIVARLAEHPGWVFSAHQLASRSEDDDFSPESVSVHVSRLRHKLLEAGAPDVVETVRGIGYRLHREGAPPRAAPASSTSEQLLRDTWWGLEQAVLEIDRAGDDVRRDQAIAALDEARMRLCGLLSERSVREPS